MSKATYEHKLTFLETDGNYGPIIHTHAFPTPAVKGSLVRLECIAYGSWVYVIIQNVFDLFWLHTLIRTHLTWYYIVRSNAVLDSDTTYIHIKVQWLITEPNMAQLGFEHGNVTDWVPTADQNLHMYRRAMSGLFNRKQYSDLITVYVSWQFRQCLSSMMFYTTTCDNILFKHHLFVYTSASLWHTDGVDKTVKRLLQVPNWVTEIGYSQ